jgi:hypothetical protein
MNHKFIYYFFLFIIVLDDLPQKLGPLSDKDSSLGREKVVTLSNYKQRERLVILEIFASSPGRGGVFLSHF